MKPKVPEVAELRFLVVDDDPLVRQTVIEYLTSFGATSIQESGNAVEALELIRRGDADFVISDWEMPGVTGLELLQLLRGDQALSRTPFMMMTSPISHEQMKIEEAALAQVDAYLIKPFRAGILKQKIAETLNRRAGEGRKAALVVDDDDAVRETVVEILESLGHDPIYQARDGEEGFALIKQHAAVLEIVVSDWEMPKLAGIELLRKIRMDSELSSLPFIMVTSQQSVERIKLKKAIDADVDQYLMKPFTVDALKAKVAEVLAKTRARTLAESFVENGKLAAGHGNWIEAEKAFGQVLQLEPRNLDGILGLAQVELNRKDKRNWEKAVALIKKGISFYPRLDRPRISLARAYESAMSLEKAIASLRESIKLCPFSDNLHYELGRLLIRRGKVEEGRAELQKTLELNPDHFDAKELMGHKVD